MSSRGEVEIGWRPTTLGAITEERSERVGGVQPAPVVLSSTKHFGLVPSDEYFKGRTIYSADLTNYKLVHRDWFAYATNHLAEGSIGRQKRFEVACVSPIYTVFSPAEGVFAPYLERVLKSPPVTAQYKVHEQATVDRRGAVRYGDFSKVRLDLPPMVEQEVIAQVLDGLDATIRHTEAVIEKLKQVKQGLLHDVLTRGIGANGELRPPQSQAPHLYKESPLGWIPSGWSLSSLGEVADVNRGTFTHRPRNDPAFYGGAYPFIQTGDVASASGGYLSTASQSLNERGIGVSQQFPAGTVAITIAANIADTAILAQPMYFPDSVVGAVVYPSSNNRFVELCIRRAKPGLEARAPQSAQKNINLQDLRPLLIPMPDRAEQDAIAERYESLRARIENEMAVANKLKCAKSGLMDDLLTGRVRVTPLLGVVP